MPIRLARTLTPQDPLMENTGEVLTYPHTEPCMQTNRKCSHKILSENATSSIPKCTVLICTVLICLDSMVSQVRDRSSCSFGWVYPPTPTHPVPAAAIPHPLLLVFYRISVWTNTPVSNHTLWRTCMSDIHFSSCSLCHLFTSTWRHITG